MQYSVEFPPLPRLSYALIMGRHLLKLNLPPGPLYSKILGAVFEAQLDGQATTLDEAIAYAKKLLSQSST